MRTVSKREDYSKDAEAIGRLRRALDKDPDASELAKVLCDGLLRIVLSVAPERVPEIEKDILAEIRAYRTT